MGMWLGLEYVGTDKCAISVFESPDQKKILQVEFQREMSKI